MQDETQEGFHLTDEILGSRRAVYYDSSLWDVTLMEYIAIPSIGTPRILDSMTRVNSPNLLFGIN
jgi:hypothetical protein